ncbi:MAG: phosphoserine phosphatase SerB [Alphaproteobacteria bacterium]
MQLILTLIGKPGELTNERVEVMRHALGDSGAGPLAPAAWLAEGEACEILLPGGAIDAMRAIAAQVAAQVRLDAVVQPSGDRRKRMLIADMDSTVITCECIDEIADAVGLKPKIAAITERAMRGEIAFEPALKERVALLKGLPVGALEEVYRDRVRLAPGAKTLVATMRSAGAHTALVSGGFTFFTARVAALAGFAFSQGNTLEVESGRLTGRVAEPILGRDAKREALIAQARAHGIDLAETLAVGDGANDLDMIREAGLGVAFHAKPKVREAAPAAILHADLTALLFIQGYRRKEFVDA